MTLIDEYTRERLDIRVAQRIKSFGVIEILSEMMLHRGITDHIQSGNGCEVTAKIVRDCLERIGARTLLIAPGSPRENGCNESFKGKLRDELLNGEIFYRLKKAKVVTEQWCKHYNTKCPHSALGYRPPVPVAYSQYQPHSNKYK